MQHIYTVQIKAAERWCSILTGRYICDHPGYIDITVGSGNKLFAPTWPMAHGVKNGSVSKESYTSQYLGIINDVITNHSSEWFALVTKPVIILGCYCRPGAFCHRYILKDIIIEDVNLMCENQGQLPISKYMGEITKDIEL